MPQVMESFMIKKQLIQPFNYIIDASLSKLSNMNTSTSLLEIWTSCCLFIKKTGKGPLEKAMKLQRNIVTDHPKCLACVRYC